MGFQTGLSGLSIASRNLDVIGNNVANSSVVGFKGASAQFSDVFAGSFASTTSGQIGIGAKLQGVAQSFNQGTITPTANALDFAIGGRGFFRLEDQGEVVYSRNGQFRLDNEGYIVNGEGLNLTGYGVDSDGNIVNAAPAPLQFDNSDIPPQATTVFEMGVNLDSNQGLPQVPTFDPANVRSYNYSTSGTVYDSLGNPQVLTIYFVNTAANQWDMHGSVENGAVTDVDFGSGAGTPVQLTFDQDTGQLVTPAAALATSLTIASGGTTPLDIQFDLTGSTQYSSDNGVIRLNQDGYTAGRLTGFNVSPDGIIRGRYNNGQSRNLGQVVLADFVNAQGLNPLGNNLWQETVNSGLALVGVPTSGTLGTLQSGAVEDSNVELTSELVAMIVAQRVYQANAQTIKTQDAVLQTLVNLR